MHTLIVDARIAVGWGGYILLCTRGIQNQAIKLDSVISVSRQICNAQILKYRDQSGTRIPTLILQGVVKGDKHFT